RLVAHEALHVLPANQRQVLAELCPIEVVQHAAVLDLLARHLLEHLGRARILRPQPVGKAVVDAGILLLAGDGEGEDLLLPQIGKALHRGIRLDMLFYIAAPAGKMRATGRPNAREDRIASGYRLGRARVGSADDRAFAARKNNGAPGEPGAP